MERFPLLKLPSFICKCKCLQAGQLLYEHFSFLQNLLNFITKYLEQEFDDNLSICLNEGSPCGLSITGDIKIMSRDQRVILPPWRRAQWNSIKDLFLLPKFDNISSSATRDKEFCQGHMIMR